MTGPARHQNGPPSLEIIRWLKEHIARVVGCPQEEIDAEAPLDGIGLSSRDALGLSGELEEWLGRRLEPTLLLDYPTIASVAGFLAGQDTPKPGLRQIQREKMNPVAITGMACRFPGAPDKDAYWRLMLEERVALKPWPRERLRLTGYELGVDTGPVTHTCRWGGFIDDIEMFDADFFQVSPREAAFMDPRQRLMLQTVWNAFEDAGWPAETLSGSNTGVYMAAGQGEYLESNMAAFRNAALSDVLGAAFCALANRVSYSFGLRGPSITLDTACAGSLYAVHLACQALNRHEIDIAIVGSVNIMLDAGASAPLAAAGLLSPDGTCRPFDARANGYVRGEGCGAVVLRRLEDAVREREYIYAVVRGAASCHTGRGLSIIAPSTGAYADVLRNALATGSIRPSEVGYIEAHGSALPQADLMELNAFVSAGILDARTGPCHVGTHKSNIGNSEVTSGLAGLIRTALILERGVIPPQASFQEPDARSPIGRGKLTVAKVPVPWNGVGAKRYAAILSQGLAGANAALLLEEAPCNEVRTPVDCPSSEDIGFVLSAKTPHALGALSQRMADYLQAVPRESLRNACTTMDRRRTKFQCRAVISGTDRDSLVARLLEVARSPEAAIGAAEKSVPENILAEPAVFPHVPLPGYPFERVRHWLQPNGNGTPADRQADTRRISDSLVASVSKPASTLPARLLESYLRETIADVLQISTDKIGIYDPFMALGLNSLLAMDVISRCSSELRLVLYPRDFLDRPCIFQLAPLLASRLDGKPEHESGVRALDFFGWRVSHSKDAARLNAAPKNGPAVFLLSAPRSGSTLLRVMLAGHSRLFCPPELHLLPYNTLEERKLALGDTGLGEGLSSALGALFPGAGSEVTELAESWQRENPDISEVYRRLQHAAAPRLLVDKSPTYAGAREILERAEALFEKPLYIYLTRHPYSVIESFVRTGMDRYLSTRAPDPYETAELVWSVSNRNLMEFLEERPDERKHQIYYEHLVDAPRQVMEALCSFLGIAFEESLLYPYLGERMTRGNWGQTHAVGDPNFLNHSKIVSEFGEVWKQVALPRTLSASTARLAVELGYTLPETQPTPSRTDFEESRL